MEAAILSVLSRDEIRNRKHISSIRISRFSLKNSKFSLYVRNKRDVNWPFTENYLAPEWLLFDIFLLWVYDVINSQPRSGLTLAF